MVIYERDILIGRFYVNGFGDSGWKFLVFVQALPESFR